MVKIDTVSTAFFIGQHNGLEVATADIGNAYLHGFTRENIYVVSGLEFGEW